MCTDIWFILQEFCKSNGRVGGIPSNRMKKYAKIRPVWCNCLQLWPQTPSGSHHRLRFFRLQEISQVHYNNVLDSCRHALLISEVATFALHWQGLQKVAPSLSHIPTFSRYIMSQLYLTTTPSLSFILLSNHRHHMHVHHQERQHCSIMSLAGNLEKFGDRPAESASSKMQNVCPKWEI